MRVLLLPLFITMSVSAFAGQKEECLASLDEKTKIAEAKANERAEYVRKVLALLNNQQKRDLMVLRAAVNQAQANLEATQTSISDEADKIREDLANFRKSAPPAGTTIEQAVQALANAEAEAQFAQEKSKSKVTRAQSELSNRYYNLQNYAERIFLNANGSLKSKFQAVIEEAQENGYHLQIRGRQQYYIDHITVHDGDAHFRRGAGSGYLLGDEDIHLFHNYFEATNISESNASYEILGWKALTEECKNTLAKSEIWGQNKVLQTLPAFQ